MSRFETAHMVEPQARVSADQVVVLPWGEALVLVVADGAGNSRRGVEAAEAVVRAVRAAVAERSDLMRPEAWSDVLEQCDRELASAGHGAETTAVVACVTEGRVIGASVGDSELWLLHGDSHSVVTLHQRRKPLVGSGEALPVFFDVPWTGGTLVAASDGLFKYADALRIRAVASGLDLTASARELAALPRLASGGLPDDVGLVLCRFRH
ncbi:SpoIIE family protein phosphatase [Pyxidicoccus fallax]|uniref:SpoIIE family protein phosphatase n=1 Tax=Pyxidicoccus fallax TaxID=394095 RepID=A0A848LIT8_9BACT|nr:protein phosphatase 2C domain-containing protein [Pyxidicoccus fallax]NMO17637.1 SpoIIE family protein phosphatase [Pyxidicoccus fallax]NPC79573.1 SpoIIE family protein phosphatase [Pyxidicoccus fallax]